LSKNQEKESNMVSVPNNPLVEKLVSVGSGGFLIIEGYPSGSKKGIVRIYRDLTLEEFVELPEASILEALPAQSIEQRSNVVFKVDAVLAYGIEKHISESISTQQLMTVPARELIKINFQESLNHQAEKCKCQDNPESAAFGESKRQKGFPFSCADGCGFALITCGGGVWCFLKYLWCRVGCAGPIVKF
jgi:hypothetical protein